MKWKIAVTYLCIFVLVGLMMALLPTHEWMVWEPAVVIPVCALLFTLLVYLSAQLAGTGGSVAKVACTALFILFFLPGAENAFARDEEAMLELSSQCIVPFFIGQYERIHTRDFRWGYLLMLLMGIFCSYTHDGITLPLCGSFLWLAFLNRDTFFKTACWPMVIGFLIGTGFSIWHHLHTGQSDMPDGLQGMLSRTGETLLLLWNTKVFLCSVALTSYLSISRRGRRLLVRKFHEHTLLEGLQAPLFMAYHDGQPFNDNMLRPCPMLENPQALRDMIKRTGAHSSNLEGDETVELLCSRCDKYAKEWKPTADKLWEIDHAMGEFTH